MNQYFSLKRFSNLYRLWWFRNHKISLIYLGVICGATILVTLWFCWAVTNDFENFSNWKAQNYFPFYASIFLVLGVFYTGTAFPGLRTKEKTFEYLLLPSTSLEKFIFEWVNRILLYVLVFPLLFGFLINLTTSVISQFYPEFTNTGVDFLWLFKQLERLEVSLLIMALITGFHTAFMGSSHFQGKPLLKTLFFFFVANAVFSLYIFGLVKLMNLEDYTVEDDCLFFACSKEGIIRFFLALGVIANLLLLAISYFKLKEKEA